MSVGELVERAHQQARRSGFWSFDEHDQEGLWVSQKLALIATEIAEFEDEASRRRAHAMLEELADVVIRIFDLAGYLWLSIPDSVLCGRLHLYSTATGAAGAMYRGTAFATQAHRKGEMAVVCGYLQDVIRAAQDYAAYLFEDSYVLRAAVEEKMAKNASRAYRHGAAY